MRLTSIIFLMLFALGCNPNSSTVAPIETEPPGDAPKATEHSDTRQIDSSAEAKSDSDSRQYTLDNLDLIIPRPIKTDSDAQICLNAANAMSDRIKRLTGAADTSRTERLADCVVQYDDDGSYSKYFPDGKRIRLYFRSADVADINIFAPGVETAIAHIRFDDTTIIISGHDSDPIGQLMLMRSDKTESFSRLGDWTIIKQPDRLEKYALDLYNDFAANSN